MSFAIHSCVVWCVVRLLACLFACLPRMAWYCGGAFIRIDMLNEMEILQTIFPKKCRWLSFSRTFLLANQLIIGLCDCIRWTSIAYSCASFSLAGTIFRFQRHFYFKLDQIDYFEIWANHFPSDWNTLTSFALHISKLAINTVFGRATSFKWIILKTLWKWISIVVLSKWFWGGLHYISYAYIHVWHRSTTLWGYTWSFRFVQREKMRKLLCAADQQMNEQDGTVQPLMCRKRGAKKREKCYNCHRCHNKICLLSDRVFILWCVFVFPLLLFSLSQIYRTDVDHLIVASKTVPVSFILQRRFVSRTIFSMCICYHHIWCIHLWETKRQSNKNTWLTLI